MVDFPADELEFAAKKLRRCARLLQAAGGEEEEALAAWLLRYSDRCFDIATGMEASPGAYDRDTSADYKVPNNVGD